MRTTFRCRALAATVAALALTLLTFTGPAQAAPVSVWSAADPLDQPAGALAGDLTAIRVTHTATVTIDVTVGTTMRWSGLGRTWQKPRTEFTAVFDTDLDGDTDFVLRATAWSAQVTAAGADDPACGVTRSRFSTTNRYRFTFPATCLGSPAAFTVIPSLYHEPGGSYWAGWTLDVFAPDRSPVIARG